MDVRYRNQSRNSEVNSAKARVSYNGRFTLFADASVLGCCTAAYVVVYQPSSDDQSFIASKSRLSKRDMTIPRLELIAAYIATNLAANIKEALPSQNVRSVTCWTDSTVLLQ